MHVPEGAHGPYGRVGTPSPQKAGGGGHRGMNMYMPMDGTMLSTIATSPPHSRAATPLKSVKLKRMQNTAAGKALDGVLRTQLRAQKDDDLPASLQVIRGLAYSMERDVDLSRQGLTDRNMVILCSVLTNHPTVRSVDLSFNPITELSAPLLLKMVRTTPTLHRVDLTETFVAAQSVSELSRILQRNIDAAAGMAEQRKTLRSQRVARQVAAECTEKLDVLAGVDRRVRREVAEEWQAGFDDIVKQFRMGVKRIRRRDQQRDLLTVQAHEREAFFENETEERRLWCSHEALSITRLFAQKGYEAECLVSQAELAARRHLRQHATDCWRAAKKCEKSRLNSEAHVRFLLEEEWSVVREEIIVDVVAVIDELKEEEQAAHDIAQRVLRERLAKEEAELLLRKQEELRLEKEKQLRIEREVRRMREFAVLQDKEARAEAARRSVIEREEALVRNVLHDVKAMDKRVYEAYASLMRVERVRTAAYGHTPDFVATLADPSGHVTHMLGGMSCACTVPKPSLKLGLTLSELVTEIEPLMSNVPKLGKRNGGIDSPTTPVTKPVKPPRLTSPAKGHLASPSPKGKRPSGFRFPRKICTAHVNVEEGTVETWDRLELASKHWRKTLRFNENEAKDECKENEAAWLPVMYPKHAGIKNPAKLPAGAVPRLRYDTEMFDIPQFSSECLEGKFNVLGVKAVLECVVPNTEIEGVKITGGAAEPHLDALILPEYSRNEAFTVVEDRHTITLTWEGETSLAAVEEGIAKVRYVAGSSADLAPYERSITVTVTVLVPALDGARENKAVVAANPWGTATQEVTASMVIPVAVIPPIFHFPPLPMVTFYEGYDADRCSLTDDMVPMKPVARVEKISTGGFVFPNPAVYGATFEDFVLRVKIINHTHDDVLLLKVADDADITVKEGLEGEARLYNDGVCFGEVVEGDFLQQTSAVEDGNVKESAGFSARLFHEAKHGTIARLFRRLRFYNGSPNPVEGIRDIEISLERGELRSFFVVRCEVIGLDDPATMTLAQTKLMYRQNSLSVPEHFRKYLRPVFLPVFEEAKVEDIDTDYFHDGELVVVMHNAMRGDELLIHPGVLGTDVSLADGKDTTELVVPDPHRCPILPPSHRKSVSSNPAPPRRFSSIHNSPGEVSTADATDFADEPVELYHEGVPLGRLEIGTYVKRNERNRVCHGVVGGDKPANQLRFRFGSSVPLPSVQYLLRSIVYHNPQYSAPEGHRVVSIKLILGDSCQLGDHSCSPPEITAKVNPEWHVMEDHVEVRVGPALLSIPGGHWRCEYREGSGHVRVAPLELTSDKEAQLDPSTGYHGGSLWVEIVEGLTDDDVLGVKLEDHMKMEPRRGFIPVMPQCLAHLSAKLNMRKDPTPQLGPMGTIKRRSSRVASLKDLSPEPFRRGTQSVPAHDVTLSPTLTVNGGDAPSMQRTRTKVRFGDDDDATSLRSDGRSDGRSDTESDGTPIEQQLSLSAIGAMTSTFGQQDSGLGLRRESHLKKAIIERRASLLERKSSGRLDRTTSSLSQRSGSTRYSREASDASLGAASNLRDRMRDRAQSLVRKQAKERSDLITETRANVRAFMKSGVADTTNPDMADIWSYSKAAKWRVGTYAQTNEAMYVKLATSRVTRKEVKELLRGLTYANVSSDETILTKVLRVTLRGGNWGVSQVIVSVDIQAVNDVTEFDLIDPRPRYAPLSWAAYTFGAWPVAAFGDATLVDPDTTHLDGGSFAVDLLGGAVKGDTTGLLTMMQQRRVRDYYDVDEGTPLLDFADGKVIAVDEEGERKEIGTVEYPRSTFGSAFTGIKVMFHDNEPQVVTLKLASYLASCVTFGTTSGKGLIPGQRAFLWRIRDKENPVEGKQRVLIEVGKPLVVPPGPTRTMMKGSCSAVLDRSPIVALDTRGREVLTTGFFAVLLVEEDCPYIERPPDDADAVLTLGGGSSSVQISKDNAVTCGGDHVGKAEVTSAQIRVDFGWASKVTSKVLSALCASVKLNVVDSPAAAAKKVIFHVSDGMLECCFHVIVSFK